MRHIIHQTQPTPNTCTSTCLAMLLGVPVEKVISEFHDKYSSGECDPDLYLRDKRSDAFDYAVNESPLKNNVKRGHVYLLTVPSLNIQGALHNIVLDFRDGDIPVIFDPCLGREGKKSYVLDDSNDENFVKLNSWVIDLICTM